MRERPSCGCVLTWTSLCCRGHVLEVRRLAHAVHELSLIQRRGRLGGCLVREMYPMRPVAALGDTSGPGYVSDGLRFPYESPGRDWLDVPLNRP